MALGLAEKTVCEICKTGGGKMRLRGTTGKYYHAKCAFTEADRARFGNPFPYQTMNIGDPNDGPVQVQSLRHMRQLERDHGVISEVFNNDSGDEGRY